MMLGTLGGFAERTQEVRGRDAAIHSSLLTSDMVELGEAFRTFSCARQLHTFALKIGGGVKGKDLKAIISFTN